MEHSSNAPDQWAADDSARGPEESKSLRLEEFKLDDDTRTISGYGSIFGNTDSYNDVVVQGAFTRTLRNADRKVKMLWQHNTSMPIGTWTQIEERDRGLFLKGRLSKTTLGNDVYELLKDGALDGLSIGYSTKKYERDDTTGIRKLTELELFEVSVVTFAANEKAKITRVKSLEELQFDELFEHKRKIEAALRDAGASDRVATYVASLIPQPAQRDAGGEELKEQAAQLEAMFKGLFNQLIS